MVNLPLKIPISALRSGSPQKYILQLLDIISHPLQKILSTFLQFFWVYPTDRHLTIERQVPQSLLSMCILLRSLCHDVWVCMLARQSENPWSEWLKTCKHRQHKQDQWSEKCPTVHPWCLWNLQLYNSFEWKNVTF